MSCPDEDPKQQIVENGAVAPAREPVDFRSRLDHKQCDLIALLARGGLVRQQTTDWPRLRKIAMTAEQHAALDSTQANARKVLARMDELDREGKTLAFEDRLGLLRRTIDLGQAERVLAVDLTRELELPTCSACGHPSNDLVDGKCPDCDWGLYDGRFTANLGSRFQLWEDCDLVAYLAEGGSDEHKGRAALDHVVTAVTDMSQTADGAPPVVPCLGAYSPFCAFREEPLRPKLERCARDAGGPDCGRDHAGHHPLPCLPAVAPSRPACLPAA